VGGGGGCAASRDRPGRNGVRRGDAPVPLGSPEERCGQPAPAANTSFDAKEAQEASAKQLGIPVETINSIGMKLRLIRLRYHAGEKKVWSVVRVPEVADEDRRQLHRELIAVQDERTEHVNRIKGLLAGQGIALPTVTAKFPEELKQWRCWDGSELGADLHSWPASTTSSSG
jgi:hypothetical protein